MIFLFPTATEAELFMKRAADAHIEISGVGMAACGAAVARIINNYPNCAIILAGIAGSYGDNVGEVVEVCEEIIEELPQRYRETYRNKAHFPYLKAVKSNTVSSSGHTSESSQVENMEGAALFAICESVGVECAQIRAISNRVGEPFSAWRVEEALEALTTELLKIYRCE